MLEYKMYQHVKDCGILTPDYKIFRYEPGLKDIIAEATPERYLCALEQDGSIVPIPWNILVYIQ
jgi:hypothetical protein